MNNIIENLITRRSIRKFKKEIPSDEVLEEICKAGSYAPSGMNSQECKIVLIKNKNIISELSKLNAKYLWSTHPEHADPFYGAPVIAIVFADTTIKTYLQDGSLVMGNLMNAAHALNVGSCWIHRAKEMFEDEIGKAYLKQWGLNEKLEGIGVCILGYSDMVLPAPPPRKENFIITIN